MAAQRSNFARPGRKLGDDRVARSERTNAAWFNCRGSLVRCGEEGRRYFIVVRNRSDVRVEIVLSVDGLDVIDGRPASFRKRGYIVNPHQRLGVEGFRQSVEAVAAFRFGPVRESYANEKYHNTRNVGVIGIALFNEVGSDPWTSEEVRRRLKANPFPGRFATPP